MSVAFRLAPRSACTLILFSLFILQAAVAQTSALHGTITDPSGAVVPGATVEARNGANGAMVSAITDEAGNYRMSLPGGLYDLTVRATGFRTARRNGVAPTEAALDVQLELEQQTEELSVTVDAPGIEVESATVGETISAKKMTEVPLNGRSFTDLLAMQAGVVPASSAQPNAVVMSGCTSTPPSGDLNPGNLSVSGQRETSNGFTVNGSNVEEAFNNGTAVVPNLDSIQDFKVLTSSFDAEFGNYSGGQVLVETKQGANKLHGSAFEFLRNTALDARSYFAPERAAYRRNQYGGTLGGAIKKDKAFFFLDYQGTRMTQGQETGNITVPSVAARGGNLLDVSSQLTGTVSTTYWAQQLSSKLGYGVSPGEAYYAANCTNNTQCVFPNAVIPTAVWSKPAANLLQYIPRPNVGTATFADAGENETLNDNKAAARVDLVTRWGNLSGYYFIDQYDLDNPYPTAEGGANVPGFNALSSGRAQLFALGLTKSFGTNKVNEAHFSYMRYANVIGKPEGGVGPTLASQGFIEGEGTLGIVPLNPSAEGIENVAFNDFTIGVDVTGETQVNNTYQWSDTFSIIKGKHTLKFGGSFHLDQVNINSNSINNGSFVFNGTETGSDFADYLLGVASTYEQGDASAFYLRNKYIGAFAQDSWKARPNLMLNYGLRWDVLPPWREKYNQLQTFVLGQKSQVYPGAPAGIVFPGDKGIPQTLSPTKWDNFSPRVGLTYSPNAEGGLPGLLFGTSGKSSIHAGAGLFYSAFEGLSAGIMSACPPYGYDYDSTSGKPKFDEPFVGAVTGLTNGQPFPSPIPEFGASVAHPNNSVDWSKYKPITGDPAFYYRNTSPYTESYNLSYEREVAHNTYLKLGYVGAQAHHLLVLMSANPGNAAACLSVSNQNLVAARSAVCGPFAEGGTFTKADGTTVRARGPFDENFDGITYQKTVGFSNYNALEATVRHTSAQWDVMASYTYGKSLDNSSSLSEPVYTANTARSKAISAFDLRHNFVASYRVNLPFARWTGRNNRLTAGWTLTGITRFTTGLPVTLFNNTDSSLLGSMPNGINNNGVDTPYVSAGRLSVEHNPRSGKAAFNADLFCVPGGTFSNGTACPAGLGTLGNAPRRFFYGPGMENFDMALQKDLPLGESRSLQFRLEGFNVFNHAQFFGAAAVNGNISSTGFGQIVNAMSPREVQLAVKFAF
ncbi:MAG: carboxypeptidase regulatory-like domain-containing protein [Acidobacteriota bacterium]|nr:carboxypeptidase regulatory-like domain-containing protein [Acidobacteriota bacterium]